MRWSNLHRKFTRKPLAVLVACLLFSELQAQTTGGVFPPFVNPGFHALQYRVAADPEGDNGDLKLNHRLHWMKALNDDYQAVVFMGARETAESNFDFDYLHAGLAMDLGSNGDKFRNGVRFDLRARDDNRPNHVGVNWMGQYYFDSGWNLRSVVLAASQFGDNAADGIFLQSRFQLAKRLQSGDGIGLEMFSFYGNSENFGSFDSQNHSIGPTYTRVLSSDWSVFTGVLLGISDGAPDQQWRLWLSRSL